MPPPPPLQHFRVVMQMLHLKEGVVLCEDINPLSVNSDQQQFSLNNIHTPSTD